MFLFAKRFLVRLLLPAATIILAPRPADGWGFSTHAYVSRRIAGYPAGDPRGDDIAMGAILPDFFWYLQTRGVLSESAAYALHGVTEEPEVVPGTTAFYRWYMPTLAKQDPRLQRIGFGALLHVLEDIRAHNGIDGFVEGRGRWADLIQRRTGEPNRLAAHVASEFAMDALVVHAYGPQLATLTVEGLPARLPYRSLFADYLRTARYQERVAAWYAPILLRSPREGSPWKGRFEALATSSNPYVRALRLLLVYPETIYAVITTPGLHWQRDALPCLLHNLPDIPPDARP